MPNKRKIFVATGARSDYGIYRPILEELVACPGIDLQVLVCGMHLSEMFGHTVSEIEADGYPIGARIETLMLGDSPQEIAQSVARGIEGFAGVYVHDRPDILVVLGDRYEMFAAASASLPFAIPLAHIHGGETTEGAIDEAMRHSLTKMSHLHFASTVAYAKRIIQMGEHPDRVFVSGAPSLDNLNSFVQMPDTELEQIIGMSLKPNPILVTYHPVTLDYRATSAHIAALLSALAVIGRPVVFTYPNADTHGQVIIEAINKFVSEHTHARAVKNLGTRAYFSLMSRAEVMVGNSSSGIIEAASFNLPVVDIGIRQKGRIRGRNVISVIDANSSAISSAITAAIDPGFLEHIKGMENPYGDGTAATKIVDVLSGWPLNASLLRKNFYDETSA